MNIQGTFLWIATFFLSASVFTSCKEEGFDVPTGTPDSNNNGPSVSDCPERWSELGGVWLDPNLCAAWSDKSEPMRWSEAEEHCATLEGTELSGWRLPTIDELGSMAMSNPPMDDVLGDLWTSSEDNASGLMWTANLEQPGMEVLLDPSDLANVRCYTSLR